MIKKRISRRIRNERRSRRLLNDSANQIYLIMEKEKDKEKTTTQKQTHQIKL